MKKYGTLAVMALLLAGAGIAAPLVNYNDIWRYRKGTSAAPVNWKTMDDALLDASWLSGPGWFGYGDGSGANAAGTTLSDMLQTTTPANAGYRTVLIRKTFTVPEGTPGTDEIVLTTDFDDAFMAWIDGVPADNQGISAELAYNDTTTSITSHEASFGNSSPSAVRTTVLGTVAAKAPAGTHVLAVMLANQNLTSSDAVLKVNLFTQTPVPPLTLHWTLADSPVTLAGTFNVPAGSELIVDPGVEVRCPGGVDAITCAGKITALGTQGAPIRFVRAVAGTAWRRIVISGTQTSTFQWCDFDGANTSGTVRGSGSSSASPTIALDHCRFLNTDVQMVELTWSSCDLTFCEFDSIGAQELIHFSNMPSAGHALIKGCRFGLPGVPPTSGYNDIVDFTGGNRPGPIAQFIDNVFLASVDDCFDMDGTDAHIEGNIFLNVKKDASRSSSSNPITTGSNGSDRSELVICRNLFYNCEHVFMEKDYGTAVLQNNTVYGLVTNPFSTNTNAGGNEGSGIIMFGEPWRGFPYGDGAVFDGNIAAGLAPSITDPWPVLAGASAEAGFFFPRRNNCIEGFPQAGVGNVGNIAVDPLLVGTTGIDHTNILAKFALQAGSPCRGTGPNGIDMGALVPTGASLSGQPTGTTASTGATVTVAGPGVWAYQWRLNGGAWSSEVSLVPASIWAGQPFTGTMLDNPVPIVLTGLSDGPQTLEVRGKNSAGAWQEAPYATANWIVATTPLDTDNDGLPDAWESLHGLNLTDPGDALADPDGDGATNLGEFIAGTDPQVAVSVFAATHTVALDGAVTLQFTAVAGKSYRIEASAALVGASWSTVATYPAQLTSGTVTFNDPADPGSNRRFYRVVTPAAP